jgi:hypothetical protein
MESVDLIPVKQIGNGVEIELLQVRLSLVKNSVSSIQLTMDEAASNDARSNWVQ